MLALRQKIVKANGAEPDEFEASVAQELLNLEVILRFSIDTSNLKVCNEIFYDCHLFHNTDFSK